MIDRRVLDYTTGFVLAPRELILDLGLRGDYGEYCIDLLATAVRRGYRVHESAVLERRAPTRYLEDGSESKQLRASRVVLPDDHRRSLEGASAKTTLTAGHHHMERDQYERMAELQDHHWWFVAKRRIVDTLVRQCATRSGDRRPSAGWVLDAGCGTGAMIPVLRQWGRVVGADVHRQALQCVSHRPVIEADVLRLPFADQAFHLLGCFDVLYHRRVADVEVALRELHRVCHRQGLLVLTDSALPALRSSHDAALHGARRFRLGSLQALLEGAGFRVIYGSYFHALLFPHRGRSCD